MGMAVSWQSSTQISPCNSGRWRNCWLTLSWDGAGRWMEAAGIDVYATARGNGFPIEVVKDHACPQNYYGLVLID